jgi:hypothetical protein
VLALRVGAEWRNSAVTLPHGGVWPIFGAADGRPERGRVAVRHEAETAHLTVPESAGSRSHARSLWLLAGKRSGPPKPEDKRYN